MHHVWASSPTARGAEIRPVITEVRGDHTLVVGRGQDGVNALCMARTESAEPEASGLTQVWTAPDPSPGRATIALTAYATMSHGDRDPSPEDVEPAFSAITGRVGADVTSVIVNTPQQARSRSVSSTGPSQPGGPGRSSGANRPTPTSPSI